MNAREVITEELRRMGSFLPHDEADNILLRLRTNGFTIMSKEDVEAVREKALEEAAEIAQYIPTPADVQDHALRIGYISASQAIAIAIRALKSGGDK